jgi:hypothetical protein
MKYACLAAAFAATLLASPGKAATFATPDSRSIVMSGRINTDDDARFLASLSKLGSSGPIEMHLASPGGSILTAMKIADVVRKLGLTTSVPYQTTCASACVLVFAAGVNRIANAHSTIAVHSVGVPGQADVDHQMMEDGRTLAVTAIVARRMSFYGAPPSVVGKMVATPTDGASVLTLADLKAWNVKISHYVPGQDGPRTNELRSDTQPAVLPIHPWRPTQPRGLATDCF